MVAFCPGPDSIMIHFFVRIIDDQWYNIKVAVVDN